MNRAIWYSRKYAWLGRLWLGELILGRVRSHAFQMGFDAGRKYERELYASSRSDHPSEFISAINERHEGVTLH